MEEHKLIISPKTKVLELIETYPELEDVLIEFVPAFKKLKNPILRKTVARIATLQQAATVGNVKLEELIRILRQQVGQDTMNLVGTETQYSVEQPAWFEPGKISKTVDIRPMLDAGEQPVNQVITDLNRIEAGSIYEVVAPFIPAPLIDKAASLGFAHWINQIGNDLIKVYFLKNK